MDERVAMTRKGYEDLKAKLERLKTVERPRIVQAIGDAREMGDLSENAEFDAAREEMWRVEAQITEMEDRLARASVVEADAAPADEVVVGRIATVKNVTLGGEDEFWIVGDGEARPDVTAVTPGSPIGQALIGHKIGDTVEAQAPRGVMKLKIVGVRPIE